MLRGAVNNEREAVVELTIRGPARQTEEVRAVIDTGFDGYLTLPLSVISRLGLTLHSYGLATLADEYEVALPRYEAELDDGRPIMVLGAEGAPLLGTALLADRV